VLFGLMATRLNKHYYYYYYMCSAKVIKYSYKDLLVEYNWPWKSTASATARPLSASFSRWWPWYSIQFNSYILKQDDQLRFSISSLSHNLCLAGATLVW